MSTLPADDVLVAQLVAEKKRRAQAEQALAAAQARIASLEHQLAATTHVAPATSLVAADQCGAFGVLLLSAEGRLQFINEPFRELLGLSLEVARPGTHLAGLHGKAAPAAMAQASAKLMARLSALHQADQTVTRQELTLADGRRLELSYLRLQTERGERLICYRDVTACYQYVAQLRALAHIPEQHHHPILQLTAMGEVLYANPAAAPLVPFLRTDAPDSLLPQLLPILQTVLAASQSHQQELTLGQGHYLLTAAAVPGALFATIYLTSITERRQAEQQRKFFEMILEQVPTGISVFDPDHRYLFVNPALEPDPTMRARLIGLENVEACALRKRPAGIAEQRQVHFEYVLREHQEVTWEEALPSADGMRYFLRRFRPVLDDDGQLQLVVSSTIDITERQQAQNRLVEHQLFMQRLVDTIPSLVCVLNSADNFVFANAAFTDFFRNTVLRNQPDPKKTPEYQQFAAWNRQVIDKQCVIQEELPLTLVNGEVRYLQMDKRPLRQIDGSIAVLTVHTDVTEVKQVRQQAERREKQYHDLVYYSQALICTHDLEGKILSVNPAIERLLGMPASKLVGRNLRDALPAEHHEELAAYLAGAVQPQPSITTILTAAGERRYLRYYTYQVTEEGYPPYVVASGYDITSGVEAERALQQAKREAEANAQAKEDFLARMSHEIRTPLNGVLGMAALLAKTPLSPIQQEYLTTMEQAGHHLLTLVNDVLDMAKITTHHVQLEQAAFAPNVVLQGVGQTLANLAERKGLQLTTHCIPSTYPAVLGDAYRLRQVLLNLLSNAIKFTEQGSIDLGVAVQQETLETLTLRFWVQDTGIGIMQEQQETIFDAFTQASGEISRRFGGTGLGLAISQQLVQHMGGTLTLCSTPEQGSTFSFTLTLPWAEAAAAVTDEQPVDAPVNYEALQNLRVLLAEDNLVNQWIATVMLEHWGVRVQAVSTGTEALAELQTHRYDAAILDIQMPGLSGVEVATAIRQHPAPEHADIPLIALTANAFEADLAKYLAAGMNACLTKPFEEAALCQLLLRLTGQ